MTRVAVVGSGFGCRVHVPALRAAGFDVVALVGQDRERTERRAQRADIPHACVGLVDALELGLDAVTVATPPHTHAPVVLDALAAGLHVLCEKPFALDAGEASSMCAASVGRVALVAHEFRCAPERALVKQLIVDGAIGTPRLATFVHQIALVADRATPVPPWWYDEARGGGWLSASGSHVIDQVRHWLGDIAAVRSGSLLRRGADADDSFSAHLGMTSGCEVAIVQSATTWGDPISVTRVAGDRGSIWIDEHSSVWHADVDQPQARKLFEAPSADRSDDPRHRFTHLELGPFTELCRRFSVAIDGGDPGDVATFADGLAAQRVLDDIRKGW